MPALSSPPPAAASPTASGSGISDDVRKRLAAIASQRMSGVGTATTIMTGKKGGVSSKFCAALHTRTHAQYVRALTRNTRRGGFFFLSGDAHVAAVRDDDSGKATTHSEL